MFNAQAFAWAHVSPFDLNLIADFAGEGARATQKQKARAGCLRLFLVSIFSLSDS